MKSQKELNDGAVMLALCCSVFVLGVILIVMYASQIKAALRWLQELMF